jgi:hypothetical protein
VQGLYLCRFFVNTPVASWQLHEITSESP